MLKIAILIFSKRSCPRYIFGEIFFMKLICF